MTTVYTKPDLQNLRRVGDISRYVAQLAVLSLFLWVPLFQANK